MLLLIVIAISIRRGQGRRIPVVCEHGRRSRLNVVGVVVHAGIRVVTCMAVRIGVGVYR